MYAKLVNGTLRRAPNKITHEGYLVFNPSPEILKANGYQQVTYTDMPDDAPEGQHYESSWSQGKDEILQMWTLVDDPIYEETGLSAEDALNIIMGVVN